MQQFRFLNCTKLLFLNISFLIAISQHTVCQVKFEEDFKELFVEVQMSEVFEDSKTFPDCIPLSSTEHIYNSYISQRDDKDFDLKQFVLANFQLPTSAVETVNPNTQLPIEQHISNLWQALERKPSNIGGSLIALPYNYIVPGGRFREIYYWDSYFTMLGLKASGKNVIIRSMIENFAYLIDTIGFIPNGNRTYYLSRSQPPFFSLMIDLLSSIEGDSVLIEFLPQLEKEYNFWMDGKEKVSETAPSYRRVVRMNDGTLLNRYWDDKATPRPESFKEDSILAASVSRNADDLYRHLRAACESGWDFSSRWFEDGKNLETIRTTELIPIDLNCLLLNLEKTIAKAYNLDGKSKESKKFLSQYELRKKSIIKYCWDPKKRFFFDYDFKKESTTGIVSAAALFPLYFNVASGKQAKEVSKTVSEKLLLPGGVATTLSDTKEQWDYPNGWPPLQWICIKGLENYGMKGLALKVKERWIQNNIRVYKNTGKMMEKYNVADLNLLAGGGEYPTQDGFGWSNGVLLDLMLELD